MSKLYSLVALSLALVASATPNHYENRPQYSDRSRYNNDSPSYVERTRYDDSPTYNRPTYNHYNDYERRATHDNTVKVFSEDHYCLILPREAHTNIGDSEHPGGMRSYCSAGGWDNDSQGRMPDNFWSESEYYHGLGPNGGKYAQLTGCIRPETIDRLNRKDSGGQYDSSGGEGGRGNPRGSVCAGYNHYVEILEPSQNRACIRCCEDFDDCPVHKDTAGCPNVIEGNYFHCA